MVSIETYQELSPYFSFQYESLDRRNHNKNESVDRGFGPRENIPAIARPALNL
jgi:hypothetical protein